MGTSGPGALQELLTRGDSHLTLQGMTDPTELTTNDRLDVALLLAISAVLAFAAVVVAWDLGQRVFFLLAAVLPALDAVGFIRQRRTGRARSNRWDGRTREQNVVGGALYLLVVAPAWVLGPVAHPDWLVAAAFAVLVGVGLSLADAVARRWPAAGYGHGSSIGRPPRTQDQPATASRARHYRPTCASGREALRRLTGLDLDI